MKQCESIQRIQDILQKLSTSTEIQAPDLGHVNESCGWGKRVCWRRTLHSPGTVQH